MYEEEKNKIDPTKIKVTELRGSFWSKKTQKAFINYSYNAKLLGAEKCVYDYFGMDYPAEDRKLLNLFLK